MGKIKEEKIRQDRKRRYLILSLTAVLIIAVGALAFVIINHIAKATVTASVVTIKQGEELPKLRVKLSEKDSKKIVLDKKKKYTVEKSKAYIKTGQGRRTKPDRTVGRKEIQKI